MTQYPDDIQDEKDILADGYEEILDAGLHAALYRQDCPETLTLGGYQLGLLAEAEKAHLAVHLDRCPYCQAELTRLAEFLAEGAPVSLPASTDADPNWIQGQGFIWRHLQETGLIIIRVIEEALKTSPLNLRQDLSPPTHWLAYGQLRSDPSRQPLFQLALMEAGEDWEVIITAEERWNDPNRCMVRVAANIPSRGGWPNLGGIQVSLKRDEVELQTQATDAYGIAIFEGIATDELSRLTFEITLHPMNE